MYPRTLTPTDQGCLVRRVPCVFIGMDVAHPAHFVPVTTWQIMLWREGAYWMRTWMRPTEPTYDDLVADMQAHPVRWDCWVPAKS